LCRVKYFVYFSPSRFNPLFLFYAKHKSPFMKRLFTLLVLSAFFGIASAQDDLGLAAPNGSISSPVSGCALTNSELVTIKIFNYGPGTIVTPFNVSYTVTGPISSGPVVEAVGAPNIPPNTLFTYTFLTPVNMSSGGVYIVDANVSLPGDPNASNDSYNNYSVVNSDPTVGGSIAPAAVTTCSGSGSGTLTLSGETGTVLEWQYSTDGGSTWIPIANTTNTLNYSNLTVTTMYQAMVQNGSCAAAASASATITVIPASVGGTVTSNATVCSGVNGGTLTLSGQTGSVLSWESSTDGGLTWTPIANVTTSQTYTNLVTTTLYHAVVANGTCASATSSSATITVSPTTVAGSVTANQTVCAPTNAGTLNLGAHTGNVIRWERSTDGGVTWLTISNTTNTQGFSNLTLTTMYRAVVQSGSCAAANSAAATVTVTPATVGGSVTSSATVCSGSNSGTLTLSGQTGSVLSWQFSTDGGVTFNAIANTTTTQNYTNLVQTTIYRAVVRSGTCTTVNSGSATITVTPPSVGGSVAPGLTTVCSGSNGGTLTLSGHTGSVIRWEYSTDGGNTWNMIANTTTTQNYNNVSTLTIYHAVVQNGVCSSATSANAIVMVTSPSNGGAVSSSATVCSGSNSGTLTLSGMTGSVLSWEFSIDGGLTWTPIANTTASQNYLNLTQTTMYHAVVQNGSCASAISSPVTITVNPVSVGGTVSSSATVCAPVNSGTLTLAGQTGNVIRWEYSTDGGLTWIPDLTNTSTSYTYTNLTATRMYRAVVQSGVCSSANSAPATITVTPATVGGSVTADATVCFGSNSGTLTLSGSTGSVLSWEFSIDGGLTWSPIGNTTTTQTYLNLTTSTLYHAIVQSGGCTVATSNPATITVVPATVGGTASANAVVCSGNNNGTITLSGQTGNVLSWEYSADGGFTWVPVNNITTSLTYNDITVTTLYHAVVQSAPCAAMASSNVTIQVDSPTIPGTIASSATVCSGTNNGTLTLSGNVGNVLSWEFSTDGGLTWNAIANTTNSETYTNISQTTIYHAIVQSGSCTSDTTNDVTITVDPMTVGGVLTSNATVCAGNNSGILSLTGQVGNVIRWEYSTDGGNTWISVANFTSSQNYLNLTQTTIYHAVVQSGVCVTQNSNDVTITVDPVSVGGTVSASATVCGLVNGDTLQVSGYTGTILDWLTSTDGGITWISTGNTDDTLIYVNLTQTTMYEVVVQSGVCSNDTSSSVTITVYPASVGGTTTFNDTVCAGNNNGTITLAGETGSVIRWEYSIDGGNTWVTISNTTNTQVYSNLMQTTIYHAVVQSGSCTPAVSTNDTITVNPMTLAGMISQPAPACAGLNSGTLTLTGYAGSVLDWLVSNDGGITWSPTGNTDDTLQYVNLNDTMWYEAVVQSGVCAPDTTVAVAVIIYPKPVAGFTVAPVCFGGPSLFTNTSTVSGNSSIATYYWDFGDLASSVSPNPLHTYAFAGNFPVTLIVTTDLGCRDTIVDTAYVYSVPLTNIAVTGSLQFCQGDSVLLVAPANINYTYAWNNGSLNDSIYVDTTGAWAVTITDTSTGCTANSATISTTMYLLPVVAVSNDTTIKIGETVTLWASGGVSYSWVPFILDNPLSQTPSGMPTATTTFTVYVTSSEGCVSSDSVKVTVDATDPVLVIANLMTPNGDGFNDDFYIDKIIYFPDNEVAIFNRNGQQVFSTTGYQNNWDGTYNGAPLPDGTYYYVVKLTGLDLTYKGAITILNSK
jgi:gliding motility-associated-like protein